MQYLINEAISFEPPRSELPSLLYIGDVPVESSYHGSALLFRLLQGYPAGKLRIVETGLYASTPARRVTGVTYSDLTNNKSRWLNTRFHKWVSSYYTLSAAWKSAGSSKYIDDFKPAALLTVAHGYGWLSAATFACELKRPLHLIVHDDWPRIPDLNRSVKVWLGKKFGQVYREAASRLCVSPGMRDEYLSRYACDGQVLYPGRAHDCPKFSHPAERLRHNDRPFTVAFGGTINSGGYVRALIKLSKALESFGGRLMIFGPVTVEAARESGLALKNVILCGMVDSKILMTTYREEVDVLFVPMSFDRGDRPNMELSFPSKLSDYTAVGIPLLVYGPPYCSAVRWARENSGVAEVVDDEDPATLSAAIRRLVDSAPYRLELGERALDVGRRYFSHDVIQTVFYQALIAAQGSVCRTL